MIGRGYLPRCVRAEVKSPADCLDVTAASDENGRILQLQVVNLSATTVKTRIAAAGFTPHRATAAVETLAADLNATNTAAAPNHVAPKSARWEHRLPSGNATYAFPGNSFTILRFE